MSKHLFYLSSEQLAAYQWQGGRLSGGSVFSHDADGIARFMDYLDSQPLMPALLLTDLVEEDFQRINVPHVGGMGGRKLLQRRLQQQYRETPYRHYEIQGRMADGRRDDMVLLAALTNPASVQPWLDALDQLQIPLAGLYSTTLLSTALVHKLGLRDEHLLLLTQQTGGWRQSYFQNGQLKFSRLTAAINRDGQPIDLGTETAKTQQFLTSVRLMGRGNVLHAVVIAPVASTPVLEGQCEDGPETSFRFLALRHVATRLRLRSDELQVNELAAQLADPMLLTLLARQHGIRQYPLGSVRRHFKLWRIRRVLYWGSAALGTASLLWMGANLWQARDAQQQSGTLMAEAASYDQRYRSVMAAMPPSVTSTANMRAAVNVERMLGTQAPAPLEMAAMVSAALEQTPQIRLLQLDWKAMQGDGATPPAPTQGDGRQAAPISSALLGIPTKPAQSLLLEAEILGDQDDYRAAVDHMNRFAQQLASNPRLTVAIDKPPLDTRSSVKLSAKAGPASEDAHARFSLILVWKP
ncbi:hypothetical protein GTP23_20765 [Pseudoduganella sp. FT93W]|uniref:Monoheme cytochrome SoxX n=1 Tax=Duganella fentianensis TaxID=2692177 RepID=A0A845I5R4_9BURK|nr:hypothetical protein [Duganella fentianensis]MYN47481.1 hypothetical protein [Duganella fentianensis]